MNQFLLIFLLSFTLPSVLFAQGMGSLSQRLDQIRNSNKVPALAALLLQNGKVADSAAVGVRKFGNATPATVHDKFHLGSDTKAMTATLAAMFVDERKFTWTSTLADLFPEITGMHPAYKSVTLEMLLAHRSGITGNLEQFNGGTLWQKLQDPTLDPREGRKILVREMLSQAPATLPGSTYGYSNQGYAVVGAILEKFSGKSWEVLIQDRLFKPLGMDSCGIGPLGTAGAPNPDQPWAHLQTASGVQPVIADNPETIGPAATVHCSMADWSKFIYLHINAFNGKPALVSAPSFAKLHASYPGQEYTYGGWIRTRRDWAKGVVFTHDGSNTLNYATVWWAPAKSLAILAVTNIGAPSGQKAAQEALLPLLERASSP